MFNLFKKKSEPLIHPKLKENAKKIIDDMFNDLLKDEVKLHKFYQFHYGEPATTPLHLDFARGILHNLWGRVETRFDYAYTDAFRVIAHTIDFYYTPLRDTGHAMVYITMKQTLSMKTTDPDQSNEEGNETQDQ